MTVSKAQLYKANARKLKASKVRKESSNQALLEQYCADYGLESLTFKKYSYVTADGIQYDLTTDKAIGNLRKGVVLVKASGFSISGSYDLTKENTSVPKYNKDWKKLLDKISKLYDPKPLVAEYFDLQVDTTSMVIEKPVIYTFASYYLVLGKLDRKSAVGKRLDPAYGTTDALLEQQEDMATIPDLERE